MCVLHPLQDGWGALHWAAKLGHEAVVKHLLVSGADVDSTKNVRPRTPYRPAVYTYVPRPYGAMLQDLGTALSLAAENKHIAIVAQLLDKGADANAKDDVRRVRSFLHHNRRKDVLGGN